MDLKTPLHTCKMYGWLAAIWNLDGKVYCISESLNSYLGQLWAGPTLGWDNFGPGQLWFGPTMCGATLVRPTLVRATMGGATLNWYHKYNAMKKIILSIFSSQIQSYNQKVHLGGCQFWGYTTELICTWVCDIFLTLSKPLGIPDSLQHSFMCLPKIVKII